MTIEASRNCWYVAACGSEVGSTEPFGRTLLGQPVVFWRDDQGQCVHTPGQKGGKKALVATTYPLIERQALLGIRMGDPALADPALIPEAAFAPAGKGAPTARLGMSGS